MKCDYCGGEKREIMFGGKEEIRPKVKKRKAVCGKCAYKILESFIVEEKKKDKREEKK